MMTSYFNLLKYVATGIASPDMTYYDRMRASTLMGGVVQTLTGQPPLSFKSDGTPLISLSMLGNGQQTGTPSPYDIIMPNFCGVRTGNLWSEDYTGISASLKYVPVYVGDGLFTLSTSCPIIEGAAALFLLAGNVQSGASTANNGVYKSRPITVNSISGYVTIVYRYVTYPSGTADLRNEQTMLNSGSTALPYEPFGYKIPISCGGETTTVYLGTVQTVRRIKKMVLTGEESWDTGGDGFRTTITDAHGFSQTVIAPVYCTHYVAKKYTDVYNGYEYGISVRAGSSESTRGFAISKGDIATVADFKSYLAAQYAAGTPVTVWYVLAEPETGIVNEPLAKIGDYADELHSEDASVTIPTIKGQNVLTVDTPIQPSEMTITYKG